MDAVERTARTLTRRIYDLFKEEQVASGAEVVLDETETGIDLNIKGQDYRIIVYVPDDYEDPDLVDLEAQAEAGSLPVDPKLDD
ncbi:MAG: hypothetical protein ACRENP_21305 [Longimicrobiales bacterium]